MRFCPNCGAPVAQRVPPGDNRQRYVCDQCDSIHYENPKLVVGCILTWEQKVLLCKRSIEPRSGYWTLPAGFMENNESTLEGAARESLEEANAVAEDLELFGVYNIPRISQVQILFYGTLKDGFASAGDETLEVKLYSEADIPWNNLAFPVVSEALSRFFESGQQRHARASLTDLHSVPGAALDIVRHH